jgi:hypothetical protein
MGSTNFSGMAGDALGAVMLPHIEDRRGIDGRVNSCI